VNAIVGSERKLERLQARSVVDDDENLVGIAARTPTSAFDGFVRSHRIRTHNPLSNSPPLT
jgi:hypothetical protein